jgi:hypothetical protein
MLKFCLTEANVSENSSAFIIMIGDLIIYHLYFSILTFLDASSDRAL